MRLKNQWETIKNNWLIIILLLVVLGFAFTGGSATVGNMKYALDSASYGGMAESVRAPSYAGTYYDNSDFAPEVEERKITMTSSLTTEVKRGTFKQAETKIKNIVKSTDSFIINQYTNKRDSGFQETYYGTYSLRVETSKYDSIVQQLKELGEITNFNENARDITGSYTDTETQIELEKERLSRYQEMFDEATDVEDKITLNDRIFQQQRTIKYLEDALENMDTRIDYTTITVSINEKQSSYANVVFVKFSELIKSFVDSLNFVLKLFFILIPPAFLILLVVVIFKLIRKFSA